MCSERAQACVRTLKDATCTAKAVQQPSNLPTLFQCSAHWGYQGASEDRTTVIPWSKAQSKMFVSIQAHTLAALGTTQGSVLKPAVLFPGLCNAFSTKTRMCTLSLGLSWLDKTKAVNIKFPFISAKTLKIIRIQKLPISGKEKRYSA